jgi:carboxypeptidase PM20D1
MVAFAMDKNYQGAIDILRADPGIVGTLSTICIATMLTGGHAENALPQSALMKVIANDKAEFTLLADSVATDPHR